MKTYLDAINPFKEYEKETGDYFRKYSKNHKGPRVKKIKYIDGEVNSCIDISHKYGFEKGSKKVFLENLSPFRSDVYIDKNNGHYYIVGIKYSDISCDKNYYIINYKRYNELLVDEKVIKSNETLEDLQERGIEFLFSLYENNVIQYEKNGEYYTERFLSRTKPKQMNYIETKPIDSSKFENQKQVGLNKTLKISKIYMDILGNRYVIKKEKFSLIIDKV